MYLGDFPRRMITWFLSYKISYGAKNLKLNKDQGDLLHDTKHASA